MKKPSGAFVKNLLIRVMYLLGSAVMAVLALFFFASSAFSLADAAKARDLKGCAMALGGLLMSAAPAVGAYSMALSYRATRRLGAS
jgi:hypothetical protein